MAKGIFFSGAIGAGKTTLGRAVAPQIGATFLDGDDFACHGGPWYASSLSTSRGIANAALVALGRGAPVIVAYPLRCTNYVYFRRRLADAGHTTIVVTLSAPVHATIHASRGRRFSADEIGRIAEMIDEGYAARSFSDLVVDTDTLSFDDTVSMLVGRLLLAT